MAKEHITIKGARVHNLKNIDIQIPRDKFVVITGLSGSGKSSLAFDTIYAEGQRRYVESLSSYARQFLGQMDKPDVDYIEGLSPAISIDQKTTSKNPRSTVGTVTEIYDYFRLLFARIGQPHCPSCGKTIAQQTIEQMVDRIIAFPERTRMQILAPVIKDRKGEHKNVLEEIKKSGFVRVLIDGEMKDISEDIILEKNKKHNIDVVVDRLIIRENVEKRLADSLETALKIGEGVVYVDIIDGERLTFSENFACSDCGINLEEITPRLFSFNNPFGACPSCDGLGHKMEVDLDLVLPDKNLSLREGAIEPWNKGGSGYYMQVLQAAGEEFAFSLDCPIKDMKKKDLDLVLYGNKKKKLKFKYISRYNEERDYDTYYEGVVPNLERRHLKYIESQSFKMQEHIEKFMSEKTCPVCSGSRLKKEAIAITVAGENIFSVTNMTILECKEFFDALLLSERELIIAKQILKEIRDRLGFLVNVGLDYLTLSRSAGTLSGGEAQRIRLATQIGSGLVGVLYILDEPSIGLHQRDNDRLIKMLEHLRDLGNTLIVVEHDEDTMLAADHIVDVGPGAGAHGGHIIAEGNVEEIKKVEDSMTGQFLSGQKRIEIPAVRRSGSDKFIEIKGASENNLKDVDVKIPLGVFTCVTGVSGSGKSTLVNSVLKRALKRALYPVYKGRPGQHKEILGIEHLDKVIDIDQSPIGRTPRSNPATYTSVFDGVREIFSQTKEARMRGYKPGRFSFNVKGGRCEACKGDGILKIEMHFLPDVYVPCEVCKGKRYNRETLEIDYKGKNISDVLEMTVEEAGEFFQNIPKIHRRLKTLEDVGLGYIKLGQPATTLSGGEAQRIKLASELSRRSNGKTLYILDEPTTGLHFFDIKKLLEVLNRLVEAGDSVLVIEHNLDVIKSADYVIDLGPEGGYKGGQVIACGSPEEISENKKSYTGQYLKRVLQRK